MIIAFSIIRIFEISINDVRIFITNIILNDVNVYNVNDLKTKQKLLLCKNQNVDEIMSKRKLRD